VNDLIPCCATPDVLPLRQTRRYRFADGHGIQTAGNTSFYVARDGAGVSITGSRTISGPSQQVSITVHNGGSGAGPGLGAGVPAAAVGTGQRRILVHVHLWTGETGRGAYRAV